MVTVRWVSIVAGANGSRMPNERSRAVAAGTARSSWKARLQIFQCGAKEFESSGPDGIGWTRPWKSGSSYDVSNAYRHIGYCFFFEVYLPKCLSIDMLRDGSKSVVSSALSFDSDSGSNVNAWV